MKYRAVAFQQMAASPIVVLFAAPATDINRWSGVPQRELLDEKETIGFQREESPTRVSHLRQFLDVDSNVIQNPLLCAVRDSTKLTFEPDPGSELPIQTGTLSVHLTDYSSWSMKELFAALEQQLRDRQPALASASLDTPRVLELQKRLGDDLGEEIDVYAPDDDPATGDEDTVSGLFTKETHVLEFWQEVKARQLLLEQIGDSARQFDDAGEFLGFTRDALESYLKPVFLVDGQHRLRGAVSSAEAAAASALKSDDATIERIQAGEDPTTVAEEITARHARILPVSLLQETNTAEHVFQFVVVNQKATPVGKALLGTIVASSLTESELQQVAKRLEGVGINVVDSQAVSWFTRNPSSPFYGLVQQGMHNEGGDKLPWSVLRDLVSVFRNLRNGKLFHESPAVDYADKWKREQLPNSGLVASVLDGAREENQKALAYWSSLDGPWLQVAAAFFTSVRDILGDSRNPDLPNGWGSTKSNLFNKVSLSILTADFFQFLTDKELTLHDASDVQDKVGNWLAKTDKAYFNRDWNLSGVKKDTPGIRAQWSGLWVAYRKDPGDLRQVKVTEFRKSRQVGIS